MQTIPQSLTVFDFNEYVRDLSKDTVATGDLVTVTVDSYERYKRSQFNSSVKVCTATTAVLGAVLVATAPVGIGIVGAFGAIGVGALEAGAIGGFLGFGGSALAAHEEAIELTPYAKTGFSKPVIPRVGRVVEVNDTVTVQWLYYAGDKLVTSTTKHERVIPLVLRNYTL